MQVTEDDYMFLPEDQVLTPSRGTFFQCYRNAYWIVHPGKGLVFFNPVHRAGINAGQRSRSWYGYPQCNTDERIARWPREFPFPVEARHFPVVFVPIEVSDYCQD